MIHVQLLEGRSDELIVARYVAALTDVSCEYLKCTREGVTLIVEDAPRARYAIGGVLLGEKDKQQR